ncbi:MAG: exo-alpha-sialidase [Akkermansia sp.]|nr:exo-alpha-sialidase [Akkermansia sp.]
MLKHTIFSLLACGLVMATESFDSLPTGKITGGETMYGKLNAGAGHAEILKGKGRSGASALHIMGGKDKSVTITLEKPLAKETPCDFWAERWTSRAPFDFSFIAITAKGEQRLVHNNNVGVGGYKLHAEAKLPAGTTAVKFVCTSDDKGGILIDDFCIMDGPMVIKSVTGINPGVYPIMKRAHFNPVMGINVKTGGSTDPKTLDKVSLKIDNPENVESVTIRTGNDKGMDFSRSTVFGTATPAADGTVTVNCEGNVPAGQSYLWVDVKPSEKALVGGTITFSNLVTTIDGTTYNADLSPITQRVGYLVAVPGEAVSNQTAGGERNSIAFRIPGLIQTKSGALVGCFDARYTHEGDLCADIDVAVVRSEDGGQTWTTPYVGMDSGPGHDNGCGDPCILQDKTGRIWMQALACHFAGGASLWTSKTGFDPKTTGQWEMTYSDDDGKTWAKEHVNPTNQIKKHEWTTILAGPGNGITLKDGTIVFPAQIWDRAANPRCMSTICYSKDGGKNWVYGNGVPHSTSECQVIELKDGSIMINCRNEARQGKRIVYVTKDLGKTWQPHSTNLSALQEPTCQGSIVKVKTKKYGELVLFSNPKSGGRNHMTIRTSHDDGKTWNEGYLYDVRQCMGYSCIAMTDDKHVGIFYETCHNNGKNGCRGIGFIRIPLETVVTGKEVPAKPARK